MVSGDQREQIKFSGQIFSVECKLYSYQKSMHPFFDVKIALQLGK